MFHIPQILSKMLIVLLIAAAVLSLTNARPNHFETNQVGSDTDNLLDSNLKPWQIEALVQRLSEMNLPQIGEDYGWERALRERGIRSPEIKRQSRYRQCYFNPISCFKK